MLLTNNEMQLVRQAVETQSGLDGELVARCSPLVHIAAFDEAVRQAFVVLEERLRQILKKDRATGMQMINYAFSSDGPFTKLLADNQTEREGFHDLLSGAFKLYRNPTAHTIVGYEGAEARAIISLIDLALKRLARLSSIPQIESLPSNLEKVLNQIEKSTNTKIANRIRIFAGMCIKEGLAVRLTAKEWISFRKQAMIQYKDADSPKPHAVTIFYLYGNEKEQAIWFPVNQYYTTVVGFDVEPIKKELKQLGFLTKGASQNHYLQLTNHTDQELVDRIFNLIRKVAGAFEATLG